MIGDKMRRGRHAKLKVDTVKSKIEKVKNIAA